MGEPLPEPAGGWPLEYRSYQLLLIAVYAVMVVLVVGLTAQAESASPSPDYSGAVAIGLLLVLVGVVAFFVQFRILRGQLDRHDESIPMPGLLGAFVDVDDDGPGAAPEVSAQELVSEISPDQGTPSSRIRCPRCGLEEERGGSAFCRGCGERLPAG